VRTLSLSLSCRRAESSAPSRADSPPPPCLADDVEIGSVYQHHVLRLCERDVLPVVPWASHHDVDEFLLADAPGWTAPLPTLVEPNSSSESDVGLAPNRTWTFPLHARFDSILSEATCVPLLRLPFQNYGIQHLEPAESVTELQTVRDRVGPDFHTYGKVRLALFSTFASTER